MKSISPKFVVDTMFQIDRITNKLVDMIRIINNQLGVRVRVDFNFYSWGIKAIDYAGSTRPHFHWTANLDVAHYTQGYAWDKIAKQIAGVYEGLVK